MFRSCSGRLLALPAALILAAALVGCVSRPIEKPEKKQQAETPEYFPQSIEKDIDILFVIDNSNSMSEEQINLNKNFPKFIDALKSPKLNDKIPNVHLGVISSDLGAGNYSLPSCEVSGGDGGKLLASPRVAGCTPPSKPYIEYIDGVVNVNNPSITDPVEKVKKAFQCIAEIGTGGCGFEFQIEAARRALDPKLNRNPGFVRKDAFLAVVFITDEDDCSAQKPQLFDPNQNQINDPLGPLTSFRCFEFGIQCECAGGTCQRTTMGVRKNCKPAYNWLYQISDYVNFFKGLKDPGRLILFAIAGPTDKIEVGMNGANPDLRPSCQTTMGKGVPALRIEALIDGIIKTGNKGYFNAGTDHTMSQDIPVNICSPDYSPALRLLGKVIVASLGGQCISQPPLTRNGGVVCKQGDSLGTNSKGVNVPCAKSCLDNADCIVTLKTSSSETLVEKCEVSKFNNPGDTNCGAVCPCWRIIPNSKCSATVDGSPYGLEILRKGEAEKGSVAAVKCATSPTKWGTPDFADLPQCN